MLRTSQEWYNLLREIDPHFELLDPDGWDRRNFEFSFHKEQIDAQEFNHRLMASTVSIPENSSALTKLARMYGDE